MSEMIRHFEASARYSKHDILPLLLNLLVYRRASLRTAQKCTLNVMKQGVIYFVEPLISHILLGAGCNLYSNDCIGYITGFSLVMLKSLRSAVKEVCVSCFGLRM